MKQVSKMKQRKDSKVKTYEFPPPLSEIEKNTSFKKAIS